MLIIIYLTKQRLYDAIASFKAKLGITSNDYPLNVFRICDSLSNVEIASAPFKTKDLRGLVHIADNKDENHVILVNGNKSAEEQNYHGCHELVHIFTTDEPGTTIQCFEKVKPNQNSYLEWLANEGAAELTIPYRQLLPLVKDNYGDMTKGVGTYEFCQEVAPSFGVTPIVVQNRINALSYEIQQYMQGSSLDEIEILSKKQQDARHIHVQSLNDMETERLSKWWKELSISSLPAPPSVGEVSWD